MKKYLSFCLLLFTLFFQAVPSNAQLRPYLQPIADDGDGAGIGGGQNPVVDAFGNPSCCESGGFSHTLSFSSFANLLALENKILRAQWAEVKRWLDRQEETFRKEINRQMGKNYSTFSEAQREFFKFYDGGRYGNSGVIARANKLLSDNSRWAIQNKEKTISNIIKYEIIDDWIACGFCSELKDLAYSSGGLAKYDVDSGPGPRFYAAMERDAQGRLFGENAYASELNSNRKLGLRKMLDNGYILDELSKIRVNHYRNQGLQEGVFLMSAYLISSSTYCPLVQSSCLPNQLRKYAPPPMWDNNTLYKWSERFVPKINQDWVLFSDDYTKLPTSYFINRFGFPQGLTYKQNINLARESLRDELMSLFIEDGIWHTACRSFEYEDLGGTGTKVAAVKGIEHPVARGGRCPGVGYVFPQQTYYFTLPSWKPRAKRESAIALEKAFDRLEKWFKDRPCTPAAQPSVNTLALKLREFIKLEFTKIGGAASIYPPAGWNGEVEEYETNIGLSRPDC